MHMAMISDTAATMTQKGRPRRVVPVEPEVDPAGESSAAALGSFAQLPRQQTSHRLAAYVIEVPTSARRNGALSSIFSQKYAMHIATAAASRKYRCTTW